MNPDEYRRMFELEDRYWWFVGRRHLALKLLAKYVPTPGATVLDVGCGTGALLGQLQASTCPVGLDVNASALAMTKTRAGFNLVQGSGSQLPFQNDRFDAILGLDVFEHIEDHHRAFDEAFRVLKPGGFLILSVPAFASLWGPHDVALHHFRRYRKQEMGHILESVGFSISKLSYSVFFMFPAVVGVRAIEKLKKGNAKASLPAFPGWINSGLTHLQDFESGLIAAGSLPWGSSVIAVAQKPEFVVNPKKLG